jgi:hypothetical protein
MVALPWVLMVLVTVDLMDVDLQAVFQVLLMDVQVVVDVWDHTDNY